LEGEIDAFVALGAALLPLLEPKADDRAANAEALWVGPLCFEPLELSELCVGLSDAPASVVETCLFKFSIAWVGIPWRVANFF